MLKLIVLLKLLVLISGKINRQTVSNMNRVIFSLILLNFGLIAKILKFEKLRFSFFFNNEKGMYLT